MSDLDPNVRAYYERGKEIDRFTSDKPSGPLELERTKELLGRYLPPAPVRILDVGGGPGVYAAWLAERGYDVHLVDPVALHVDQARAGHPKVAAEVGDARALAQNSGSTDVVLLLGPLYHLVERQDRLRALGEAHRVLREEGLMFAAAISRYAALLDLLVRVGRLYETDVFHAVRRSVQDGVFDGTKSSLFTTAYFHLPQELAEEVREAGFEVTALLNIEGPGFLLKDFANNWADLVKREVILETARLVEDKPEMLGASSHILAVARKV